MKNKEITLTKFAVESGLTVSQVSSLIKKGEILSRVGYKHRYIPISELEKVKAFLLVIIKHIANWPGVRK